MIARTAPSTRCSGPQGQAWGSQMLPQPAGIPSWPHTFPCQSCPRLLYLCPGVFFFPSAPCLSICFCFPDWGQAMLEDL